MTILLLVNVQNLFHSCRRAFGPDARVDFSRLIEAARNSRQADVKGRAYISRYSGPGFNEKGLVVALRAMQFETKVVRHPRTARVSVAPEIILDAMEVVTNKPEFTCVVVAGGDTDLLPLYDRLRSRKIRVEVLGFENSISTMTVHRSSEVRLLGRSVLFRGPADDQEHVDMILPHLPEGVGDDGGAARGSNA